MSLYEYRGQTYSDAIGPKRDMTRPSRARRFDQSDPTADKAPSKSRSAVGLPQCYLPLRSTGEIAGLVSYGPNLAAMWRQLAVILGKVLKGAKPADVPVEQPTKLELVVNFRTAKSLDLTIPPSVLLRADEVIE